VSELPLSVLDVAPVAANGSTGEALRNTTELARREGQALGSPATVRKQLTDLLEATQADEFMLTCMVYDLPARARSFELIRDEVAPALRQPSR
jgi:alkanesulfonate monooxygenase SsuD/methylene tetrahydromethanopterin reductase-like flavin-dependent oxidoreductase (luciferase family)